MGVSMERMLLVPVQASKTGALAVRIGRLPSGERVGLAFTSESAVTQMLGPSQQWIHLAARTLAALLAPLGVEQITVDPGRPTDRPHAPRTPMARAKASSMAPMARKATLTGQPRRP